MDRMISLFGRPNTVTYDIRNNEVEGAVDNYFDVSLHYGNQLKIKLKTNHIVAKIIHALSFMEQMAHLLNTVKISRKMI